MPGINPFFVAMVNAFAVANGQEVQLICSSLALNCLVTETCFHLSVERLFIFLQNARPKEEISETLAIMQDMNS